jgi:hypothetical protein
MAPRRDSSTVTRPTSGVILQAGDPTKIEEEKLRFEIMLKRCCLKK